VELRNLLRFTLLNHFCIPQPPNNNNQPTTSSSPDPRPIYCNYLIDTYRLLCR